MNKNKKENKMNKTEDPEREPNAKIDNWNYTQPTIEPRNEEVTGSD